MATHPFLRFVAANCLMAAVGWLALQLLGSRETALWIGLVWCNLYVAVVAWAVGSWPAAKFVMSYMAVLSVIVAGIAITPPA